MSWSISIIGRAAAVAAKASEDLARVKCTEPEETIKGQVGQAIATALAAYPANDVVKVEASGSQSSRDSNGTAINNLSVAIHQVYGFVENAQGVQTR